MSSRSRLLALLVGIAVAPALGDSRNGATAVAAPNGGLDTSAAKAEDTQPARPLSLWRDGRVRSDILSFVARVTDERSPDYVRPADRVAVFDNDGTLWSEQPIYVQAYFIMDRLRALAPEHPEWKTEEPFRAAIQGDLDALKRLDASGLARLASAAFAGLTEEEIEALARDFLKNARHPQRGVPFTALSYAPMVELIRYLGAAGFKVFIVTGSGVDFVRAFSEEVYGIPKERVIGTAFLDRFEIENGKSQLERTEKVVEPIDDGAGKAVNIGRVIGRRPVFAFGNSDGDIEMLEYATSGEGARLGLLLHHDDAEREVRYDRESAIGRLDKALDEAGRRGWTVVSMKDDFRVVFGGDGH